jgi:transcriptional regulator with XRE-family HTH domain
MVGGESPAVARRRLRIALRRARQATGLTQRQVAESLDWSLSKVNRIEAGEVTVSGTDLQAMLRLFEVVDREQVSELTREARAARQRGWWDEQTYRERLTPAMVESLQFESAATMIRSFQPALIPGVLQTRAYAESIMGFWNEEMAEAVRGTRVEVRMLRRERLFGRSDSPNYLLVLDESVLLREVGGPQIMADQLEDLLGLIRARSVTVRVIPLAHTTIYATFGLFVIYTTAEEDLAVYRESHLGDEMVYELDSIQRHRQRFEQVWEQSMNEDASIRLIAARAAAIRSDADRRPPGG